MAETQNTGQFAKTIVTDVGKDMIAKSQNGQTLTFSRVALGDGLVSEEEDVTKFTAVKNERLSLPIAKYSNLGNGQFQIQFRLTNSQVESGFWHREIGIMAKIDNGQEQLYAYTTAGNKASFIYDKTTPVEERIVNVNFVIGNAQNLEVIINSSVIYATIEDLEEALDAHDAGTGAHEPAFDAHNAADDAHKDFTGATAKAAGKRGMVPAPAAGAANRYLKADGTWGTIDTMNGASSSESGSEGLVPGPEAGAQNKFLRGDGTWQLLIKAIAEAAGVITITNSDGTTSTITQILKAIQDGNGNNIVNTYATKTELSAKAPLASPTFTGTPKSTTPASSDNSTRIATTAFVKALVGAANNGGIVSANLAQNGYVKFANGFILQWSFFWNKRYLSACISEGRISNCSHNSKFWKRK